MISNKLNLLKYALFLYCIYTSVCLSQSIEEIDLGDLNGSNGFVIPGVAANDFTGFAVSSAGDINADGLSDIIIGADGANRGASLTGVAYVIFGSVQPFNPTIDVSSLNGSNGFVIDTSTAGERLGWSVSQLGDINADSIDDVMACAPFADIIAENEGVCYVIFGSTSDFPASFNTSTLNGSNGFKIKGAVVADRTGMSSSSAGDFNGDGLADILIGAPPNPSTNRPGSAYILFGRDSGFSTEVELSDLNGADGVRIDGWVPSGFLGVSVSCAGDVNNDNIDDVLIGTAAGNMAYVVFGQSGGFPPIINISELNGSNGFSISISQPGIATLGTSVSDTGDLNHDGIDDLILGTVVNKAYVIFGRMAPFDADFDLSSLDGSNGFVFTYHNNNTFEFIGYHVNAAGDFNGDGYDDVLIGSDAIDGFAGYIYFGHDNAFPPTIELSTLTQQQGIKILAFSGNSTFAGTAFSSASDINGDGINDLIYGQQGAFPNGTASGAAAVMFGRGNDLIFKHGFESIQQ